MERYICIILLFICSCQPPKSQNAGWQKVFQNDANGNVVFGEKSQLIDAVRLGYPIRIGWGGNRVEHVAQAEFITIFQSEVFAQTKTIIGQAPRIDSDSVKIRFRQKNHWTKIAGSNGYSTSIMTDYMSDSIVGGGKDQSSASTWFVHYPIHQSDIDARPLWKEGSPNWEKERFLSE